MESTDQGRVLLSDWIQVANAMLPGDGRMHALTMDIASALKWTSEGLLALSQNLMTTQCSWRHET